MHRRRQVADWRATVSRLRDVLSGFMPPDFSSASLNDSLEVEAACRKACATVLAGTNDAVLAVRKAVQSASDAGEG